MTRSVFFTSDHYYLTPISIDEIREKFSNA